METITFSKDTIVADLFKHWPNTTSVFLHRRMGCVGCTMAPFETVAEVANIYGLCCSHFVKELQDSISKK